jgi:hypothetical protein
MNLYRGGVMANNRNEISYGLSQALTQYAPMPIVANRVPVLADINWSIGQMWVYSAAGTAYILVSVANGQATWILIETGGGAGVFASIVATTGPNDIEGTTSINTTTSGAVTSIGSTLGASGIVERVGTGNYSLDGVAGSIYSIGASTTTGSIAIGGTAQTGTLAIGPSTAGITILIGNGVNAAPQVVNISSGASAANSVVSILNGVATAGTQTFNVLAQAGSTAGAANIATGTAANVLTMGSLTGAASTTIRAGTGGLVLTPTTGNASLLPASTSTAGVAVTSNVRVGKAVFTGQTIISTGTQDFTITNSTVATTSGLFCTVSNLNVTTNNGYLSIAGITKAAGSFIVHTINNGPGSIAPTDDITITFWVIS